MIYVAHPLAGDIAGNCDRAEWFLAQLMVANPDETFVLPWVSYVRAGLRLFADAPMTRALSPTPGSRRALPKAPRSSP